MGFRVYALESFCLVVKQISRLAIVNMCKFTSPFLVLKKQKGKKKKKICFALIFWAKFLNRQNVEKIALFINNNKS